MAPNRREFFVGAGAVGVSACVGEVGDEMTQGVPSGMTGPAPWKMWGSSVQLETASTVTSEQIVSIDYRRPETWRFLLYCRLLDGQIGGAGQDFQVDFFVNMGVGRSMFQTAIGAVFPQGQFATFGFTVPAGQRPGNQPNNNKWTTVVRTPPTSDGAVGGPFFERCETIVAQTIQCTARFTNAGVAGVARAEVGAFFVPNVHIRPDWFMQAPNHLKFKGGETNGS